MSRRKKWPLAPRLLSPEAARQHLGIKRSRLTSFVPLHLHTNTLYMLTRASSLHAPATQACTPPRLPHLKPPLTPITRSSRAILRGGFFFLSSLRGLRHVQHFGLGAGITAPVAHQRLFCCTRCGQVALVRRVRQRATRVARRRRSIWPGHVLSTLPGWGVSHDANRANSACLQNANHLRQGVMFILQLSSKLSRFFALRFKCNKKKCEVKMSFDLFYH